MRDFLCLRITHHVSPIKDPFPSAFKMQDRLQLVAKPSLTPPGVQATIGGAAAFSEIPDRIYPGNGRRRVYEQK
jgi:hypothetical protein